MCDNCGTEYARVVAELTDDQREAVRRYVAFTVAQEVASARATRRRERQLLDVLEDALKPARPGVKGTEGASWVNGWDVCLETIRTRLALYLPLHR